MVKKCLTTFGGVTVPTPPSPAGPIIYDLIGAALAWPLARIPIYYRRHQIMLEEQRITGGHTVAPRKHWD